MGSFYSQRILNVAFKRFLIAFHHSTSLLNSVFHYTTCLP